MSYLNLQLTSEEKLLLFLCRRDFDETVRKKIGNVISNVSDWNRFADLANRHGIIALCRDNLLKTCYHRSIPGNVWAILENGYYKSLARNTFIYKSLEEISNEALRENIKIVLLKGLALEKTVYGNKGLRQMNDLDLLATPGDAMKLRDLLLNEGYTSAPMISRVYEKKMFVEGKHLPAMYKNGLSTEIHFKLFEQKRNSLTEEIIESSSMIPGTMNLFIPDAQLHFLYLIKHLDKHEKDDYSQLRLYMDLIFMIDDGDQIIDDNLYKKANDAGVLNILKEKLTFIEVLQTAINDNTKLYDIPLPDIQRLTRLLREPEKFRSGQPSALKPLKNVPGIFNKFLFITGYMLPSMNYLKYYYQCENKMIKKILAYPRWWIHIVYKFWNL
jgi:hypothetical protein